MGRLIGLDWGEKRIGVAVSDERNSFAVGYDIWPADEAEFLARLKKTLALEQIDRVVVGYPLTLRGEVGVKARQVEDFIAKLESHGFQVVRWDERYSTKDASRTLTLHGISQKKQRGRIDMAAAILMLQSYLDANPS